MGNEARVESFESPPPPTVDSLGNHKAKCNAAALVASNSQFRFLKALLIKAPIGATTTSKLQYNEQTNCTLGLSTTSLSDNNEFLLGSFT